VCTGVLRPHTRLVLRKPPCDVCGHAGVEGVVGALEDVEVPHGKPAVVTACYRTAVQDVSVQVIEPTLLSMVNLKVHAWGSCS
jgi:hypothetical protein